MGKRLERLEVGDWRPVTGGQRSVDESPGKIIRKTSWLDWRQQQKAEAPIPNLVKDFSEQIPFPPDKETKLLSRILSKVFPGWRQ